MIENCVQTSVFNLLTNSMSVNGQVYDIANQHAGFHEHFISEETLSRGDSPTHDQDISRIKYTCGANFTKLCRRHRETSTTNYCEAKVFTYPDDCILEYHLRLKLCCPLIFELFRRFQFAMLRTMWAQ